MANLGGYTNIPDNLIDAQNMIVSLLNQLSIQGEHARESLRDLNLVVDEILADREKTKELQK